MKLRVRVPKGLIFLSGILRESRLLLCDLTARVIQSCLDLLGIKTVERM